MNSYTGSTFCRYNIFISRVPIYSKHYCFGTCDSKPDPDIPDSGSDKPDKPDQNLCPKCGLPLVDCKCGQVCLKCGEPIKECKCPKKVDCSEQAIHNSDTASYNWNKFMDVAVHNHPRSNPPSISDVLTLAKMNKRSEGKFESSFIVPKTGPIYVLQVTDKAKAAKFYELYESKSDELTTKREEYLTWFIRNGGVSFPEKEFDGYSLAAILQEIDCGISLLQVEGDSRSFKQMEAAVERENGEVSNIIYTICK